MASTRATRSTEPTTARSRRRRARPTRGRRKRARAAIQAPRGRRLKFRFFGAKMMTMPSFRARALACALLAGTALAGLAAAPAHAQAGKLHRAPDANGVDLTWGDYVMRFKEGSIGSGEAEL